MDLVARVGVGMGGGKALTLKPAETASADGELSVRGLN